MEEYSRVIFIGTCFLVVRTIANSCVEDVSGQDMVPQYTDSKLWRNQKIKVATSQSRTEWKTCRV